ncbi:9512_t:CDS:2, partial [Cetraspora pellucida]
MSDRLSSQEFKNMSDRLSSQDLIKLEHTYGAHNYHPIPIVFSKGEGAFVWDRENNMYLDFLCAYSAVNQGHCHPKIVKALCDQAQKLCLSSRAFYNDVFGTYAKYITEYFNYSMVLPMNTGAEAVETGIKLARKWGYLKKNIPENEAIILTCEGNFHGRTTTVISMSSDPDCRVGFGPYMPLVGPVCPKTGRTIKYNSIEDLEAVLEANPVNVPDDGYLKKCSDLCKKYNVLLIVDEIQTGLGRTGKMLCQEYDGVRGDIILLGKALSGGVYPVSAVLADKEIMLCIQPGEHGSTYGGNPLGSAVAIAALEVIKDEHLVERAASLGEMFREAIRQIDSPLIKCVRGRGLLNALVINEGVCDKNAWHLCLLLKSRGLLAKPTHGNMIRLAPALTIKEEDLMRGVKIIEEALRDIVAMN